MWPSSYRDFVARHSLVGAEVEVPASADLTGIGASIEILDEDAASLEANEAYPGVIVKMDGYIPIGGCLLGSGDQYFLNVHDEQPGPLYRIDHESVSNDGYDRQRAVARVLQSYGELLRYVDQ